MRRGAALDQNGSVEISRSESSEVGGRRSEIFVAEVNSWKRQLPTSDFRIPTWLRFPPCHFIGLIALLAFTGCEDGIEARYGQRTGLGADSVNGTAVLASMFEQAGHRVSTTSRLTPKLMKKADAIVWAPDDFQPPSSAVRDWFDDWWSTAPGRTLIYIGRDYDAAPGYWRAVQASAPKQQLAEFKRRLAKAQSEFRADRAAAPNDADCDWFTVKGKLKHRQVQGLSGEPEWRAGIDVSKLGIELNGRLLPSADAQVVLQDQGDLLVSRETMHGGTLIVVANGSFLLNLPLINHEHRKLAARLIAETGADHQVTFLESGAGGPPVFEKDPTDAPRNELVIFGVKPFDSILLHLAIAGVIFCAARYPIFGRPHELAPPRLSDFSRHIWALGQMLERTKDRAYALGRILHYQQNARRDGGRSRPPAAPAPPSPPPAGPAEPASPGDE